MDVALKAQHPFEFLYGDHQYITQCQDVKHIGGEEYLFVFAISRIEPINYHDSLVLGSETYFIKYNRLDQTLIVIDKFSADDRGFYPGFPISSGNAFSIPIIEQSQISVRQRHHLISIDVNFYNTVATELDFRLLEQAFPLETIGTSLSVIDDSSNLFMSGYLNDYFEDQISFIAKFDSKGTMLTWDTLNNFPLRSLYLLENKHPVMYSKKWGQFAFYDNELIRDTLVRDVGITLPFVGFNDALDNQFRCLNFGSKLLFSGRQKFYLNPQLDKKVTEMISFVNTRSFTVDSIITVDLPPHSDDVISFAQTVDTMGPYIFFSNALRNAQSYIFYGNYNSPLPCTNHVSLHKADTNGVLYWSKYFGGDACYFSKVVESTMDSGVILVVDRYDPENDASENQYYIKLDKDGNQESNFFPNMDSLLAITTGIEDIDRSTDFAVYPNPSADMVTLQVPDNLMNQELNVYSIDGKRVWREAQLNRHTVVNVSQFPAGVYIFQIGMNRKKIIVE